jgi:hypothetical protein
LKWLTTFSSGCHAGAETSLAASKYVSKHSFLGPILKNNNVVLCSWLFNISNCSTNFLVENKFHQTILHVVLKAGYYNKLVVYGDESAGANIQTIRTLFSTNNLVVQSQMRSIINRLKKFTELKLNAQNQRYKIIPNRLKKIFQ